MGKSNNPAKRATQEAAIQAKKSKRTKGAGFLKFVLIMVLLVAIIGPFFAGLTNLSVNSDPVAPATIPATAPATIPATVAPASPPVAAPATATTPAPAKTPAG